MENNLIRRIKGGDVGALDILVNEYYEMIYRFCYCKLNGDTFTAADITQDVFASLIENIKEYRFFGKFKNYIFTIAINKCKNYYKKSKTLPVDIASFEIRSDIPDLLEKIEKEEMSLRIKRILGKLPDYQKDVIILRFYHEMKVKDIAAVTGVSLPTAKSRLRQGMEKIRTMMEDEDFEI